MTTVKRTDLGQLNPLGKGGQGTVYAVPDFHLPAHTDLVYKEYKKAKQGLVSEQGLQKLIQERDKLDANKQARLDALSAWPLAVVTDSGLALGVLMRRIPPTFYAELKLPSGKKERSAMELQHVVCDPVRAKKTGAPLPTSGERIALCREIAYFVGMLHKCELVYGDLNPRNILYATKPEPAVMFVDCDAIRKKGAAAVIPQFHQDDWVPPEGHKAPQTVETDLYKLGLAILRTLSPVEAGSTGRDPLAAATVLDAAGMNLLVRALSTEPKSRTSAREWVGYFDGKPSVPSGNAKRKLASSPPAPVHTGWKRDPSGAWVPA